MATKEEQKNVTGLDLADDYKEAEYDLVKSLLEASDFKTSDDEIYEVRIERNGKFLFMVRIHPLSDSDVKDAQKKAGIYKTNPTNKKLGQVKVDTDTAKLGSWLIYLATVEEDQANIWGNSAIMKKFGLFQPWESIDYLLKTGEKNKLVDKVLEISGMNDDEEEQMDEEEFQPASN
ncbi:MAG: hypothetical protein ACI4PO_09110 [Faecousia sp.]